MRKRWLWILLPLLAAGGSWLFGRAPARHALEQECRRYQQDRVAEDQRFQRERARLIKDARAGADTTEALMARRAAHERYLLDHRRLELGGWTVLLIPPGATPPAPGDFYRAESHDPSAPADAPHLRGAMEIWLAPRGGLARLLFRLGLSP
ncbi:MAG: hypothetical protein ACYS0K_20295 [Planctomycetota bacterium]